MNDPKTGKTIRSDLPSIDPRWASRTRVNDARGEPLGPISKSDIVVCQGLEARDVIDVAATWGIRNVIQESTRLERDLNSAALMTVEPELFLECPLSAVLDPLHAGSERERKLTSLAAEFQSISDREAVASKIGLMLEGAGCPGLLREDVQFICDELLTNVVYNAPYRLRADETNPGFTFAETRDTLPAGLKGRLTFGMADESLVICCEDPFGSLEPDKVLARLNRCYKQGLEHNIRWDTRGAGIGSFLVYERCSSYYLSVDPMGKTLVVVKISLLRSARARASIPKSIHWFETAP